MCVYVCMCEDACEFSLSIACNYCKRGWHCMIKAGVPQPSLPVCKKAVADEWRVNWRLA